MCRWFRLLVGCWAGATKGGDVKAGVLGVFGSALLGNWGLGVGGGPSGIEVRTKAGCTTGAGGVAAAGWGVGGWYGAGVGGGFKGVGGGGVGGRTVELSPAA